MEPVATPVAIEQPANVPPELGQPVRLAVPLLTLGALASETPAGKLSLSVMGAVVGPLATAMVML